MAKIVTETLVISFSRIAKDAQETNPSSISEELQQTLEQVAQELVGDAVVVEVERV
jgi:histone H3/H4